MNSDFAILIDEDQPRRSKRIKLNNSDAEQKKTNESVYINTSHGDNNQSIIQHSDEQEIKIEYDDIAEDPLQINETFQKSMQSKAISNNFSKNRSVVQPQDATIKNCPVPRNIIANPAAHQPTRKQPIILRKISKPPKIVVKRIKAPNVTKLNSNMKNRLGKAVETSKTTTAGLKPVKKILPTIDLTGALESKKSSTFQLSDPSPLRKLINPSETFLKQIKAQNVATLKFNMTDHLENSVEASGSTSVGLKAVEVILPLIDLTSSPLSEKSSTSQLSNLSTSTVTRMEVKQGNTALDNIRILIEQGTSSKDDAFSPENDVFIMNKVMTNQPANVKDNLCIVTGCTGKVNYYFRVPEEEKRLRIWMYCLKNQKVNSGDLICEQHFIPEDILKMPEKDNIGELKPFAVPSLKPVLAGCCVPQCVNKNQNAPNMYPIPIWGHYTPWIMNIDESKLKIGSLYDFQQLRVCERHFSAKSLEKTFTMVPTLHLPSKDWYADRLQNYLKTREQPKPHENHTEDSAEVIQISSTSDSSSNNGGIANKERIFCSYSGCKLTKDNAYFKFYEFPTDYCSAVKWLETCKREDILSRSREAIKSYIANSIGLCFQHKNTVETIIRRNEMKNVKEDVLKNIPMQTSAEVKNQSIIKNHPEKSIEDTLKEMMEIDSSIFECDGNTNKKIYVPIKEYCAFVNCSTYIRDQVKKYRFPADKELLENWIKAAGIPPALSEDTIRSLFVCGKHFNKDQYNELGTLIFSSVPASHTEFVDTTPHEDNAHWIMKQRQTLVILKREVPKAERISLVESTDYTQILPSKPQAPHVLNKSLLGQILAAPIKAPVCVVKHCTSTMPTNYLYPFPDRKNDQARFLGWIKAVENGPKLSVELMNYYNRKKICGKHFHRRYQIGSNLLRDDAMPTLDLVEDVPEDEKDTTIEWKECESDICDTDNRDSTRTPHIKGNAILRESSIEFPNLKRELKFGKHCPRMGRNRFPFKMFRMPRVTLRTELEYVNPGHKLQIHTAIIVDDDDEAERQAVSAITGIIMKNAQKGPKRRREELTET